MASLPLSLLPSAMCRWVPGRKNSEPVKNVPFGTTTTPPPLAAAVSITFCIASVCSRAESFFTP